MDRFGSHLLIGWLVLALSAMAGGIFFLAKGTIEASPILIQGTAPLSEERGLPLFDGREIEQTIVPEQNMLVTSISVGMVVPDHIADGRLHIAVADEGGQLLLTASKDLRQAPLANLQTVSGQAQLMAGQVYRIRLTTNGVDASTPVHVQYEGNIETYPAGGVLVRIEESVVERAGNIRFQVGWEPTPAALGWVMIRAPHLMAGLGGIALAGGLLAWPRSRRVIVGHFMAGAPENVQELFSGRFWLATVLTGCILSFLLTAPLYREAGALSSQGDINHLLVYAGVARSSVVEYGQYPMWQPILCGGTPLAGHLLAWHWNPLFLFTLVFGEALGFRFAITGVLIIAFIGTTALARYATRATLLAALVAGGLVAFAGYFPLNLGRGYLMWNGLMWLPWILLAVLRSYHQPRWGLVAGAGIGLTLLGGSLYGSAQAIVAATGLWLLYSLRMRTWRPLLTAGVAGATAFLVAAPALLPALSLIPLMDTSQGEDAKASLAVLADMLVSRNQVAHDPVVTDAETFGWPDFGLYIGWLPLLLALPAVPRLARRHPELLAIGALALVAAVGGFAWLSDRIAAVDSLFRVPSRLRIIFLVVLAVLVADTLTRLRQTNRRLAAVAAIVGLFIIGDLLWVHRAAFQDTFPLPPLTLPAAPTFERIESSYSTPDEEYYRVGYATFVSNRGTRDLCPTFFAPHEQTRNADTSNPLEPYEGELFFSGEGQLHNITHTRQTWRADVQANQPGLIVLNQNYYPGWRSSVGEVAAYEGRVAVQVPAGDYRLTVSYRPLAAVVGGAFGIASAGCAAAAAIRSRQHRRRPARSVERLA